MTNTKKTSSVKRAVQRPNQRQQGNTMSQQASNVLGARRKKSRKTSLGLLGSVVLLILYLWLGVGEEEQTAALEDRIPVSFVRVVDGDTLIVKYEGKDTRVRMIGINAPESVHADESKNTQEGRDASAFMKEYLADTKELWLEFDKEPLDQYDRYLAYVWMNGDGTDVGEDMLNGIIVKKGYAQARYYAPNGKYQDELNALTPNP